MFHADTLFDNEESFGLPEIEERDLSASLTLRWSRKRKRWECRNAFFWQDAKSKIRKTAEGKTLRLNVPKEITNLPASVMETLRKENVGLRINWNGKPITIPAGKAQPKQKMRIYWTMQTLEKLYNA